MKIQSHYDSIYVSIGSEIDIYRLPQISINSKIEELKKPDGFIYYQVENLKSARELCRKFINEFNLGSSNWIGGRVIDENLNFIANISYNGRVWDNEDWKKAEEIEIC